MQKVRLSYEALGHVRDLLEDTAEEELYTKFADAWNKDYLISSPPVYLEASEVKRVRDLLREHIANPSTTNSERRTSRGILTELESKFRG